MNRRANTEPTSRPKRLQDRLLFWLAVGLTPETAPWYVGYAPSLYRQIELARTAAVPAPVPQTVDPELPVEAPRRAA